MSNNQGYVWVPYIMVENFQVISELDFSPKSLISSRYSTQQIGGNFFGSVVISKNRGEKRRDKIDNIYK